MNSMIAMRGGIEKLGLPAITLQLMTWYDALMAAESGTPAYFADLPKKMALPSFSNEEAVRVTNVSSPHRDRHPGYGTMRSPELKNVQPAGPPASAQPSCARPGEQPIVANGERRDIAAQQAYEPYGKG